MAQRLKKYTARAALGLLFYGLLVFQSWAYGYGWFSFINAILVILFLGALCWMVLKLLDWSDLL